MVSPATPINLVDLPEQTSTPAAADEMLVYSASADEVRRVDFSRLSAALGLNNSQIIQLIQNTIEAGSNITVTPTGNRVVIAGQAGGGGGTGDDGWSARLAAITDGQRIVLQVQSWVGGGGTPPASGSYIGPTGFVGAVSAGVDIRGATGARGAQGATGARGAQGNAGAAGSDGNDAWTPTLAIASDGNRRVIRIPSWTGGEGTAPTSNVYLGSTGLVGSASAAVDIRGPRGEAGAAGAAGQRGPQGPPGTAAAAGDDGWSPRLAVISDSARRVLQVQSWVGGDGTAPTSGLYVGATGLVGSASGGVDIRGPQGAQGPAGAAGAAGAKGDKGDTGAAGAAGRDGTNGARGPQGMQGIQGPQGTAGTDGRGVPAGGSDGQALVKASGTDYDTEWQTITTGSGGLNQSAVDGRIRSLVNSFARDDSTDVPVGQIPVEIARLTQIYAWAHTGDNSRIPSNKLPTNIAVDTDIPADNRLVPSVTGVANGRVLKVVSGVPAWAVDLDSGGGLNQTQVDARITTLIASWAYITNDRNDSLRVPFHRLDPNIRRVSDFASSTESRDTPLAAADTASVGVRTTMARSDHTHPYQTGGLLQPNAVFSWAKTGGGLIPENRINDAIARDSEVPGLVNSTIVAGTGITTSFSNHRLTIAATGSSSSGISEADFHRLLQAAIQAGSGVQRAIADNVITLSATGGGGTNGLNQAQVDARINHQVQQFALDTSTQIGSGKIPAAFARVDSIPGYIHDTITAGSGITIGQLSNGRFTITATGGSASGITEADFHRLLQLSVQAGSGLMRTIANNVITLATSGGGGTMPPPAQSHTIWLATSHDNNFSANEFTVNNTADPTNDILRFPSWVGEGIDQSARYVAVAIPTNRSLDHLYQVVSGTVSNTDERTTFGDDPATTVNVGGEDHDVYVSDNKWLFRGNPYQIVTSAS